MDMQAGNFSHQSVSSSFSLNLIKQLTVGQRDIASPGQLSSYLNSVIFPQIGPFYSSIYLRDRSEKIFRIVEDNEQTPFHITNLSFTDPLIKELIDAAGPMVVDTKSATYDRIEQDHHSVILLPIFDEGDLFGIIQLSSFSPVPDFSQDQRDTLQTLAEIVGSRLKSLATINQVKKSIEALEYSEKLRTALYEISELALTSQDLSELYPKVHDIVRRLIFAKNFYISIIEERDDGQYITFPYFSDTYNPEFHGTELKLSGNKQPVTAYLSKSGQPLLITPENYELVRQQFRIDFLGTVPYSWLGAPFYLGKQAGAVAVMSYEDVVYTEKDKELIAFVARHIGDALKRKQSLLELRAAKDRAEIAEKKKSAFLANMSHEIRTPMNGILGLTELVLQSSQPGQNRSYLEMVRASAERLLKLINDILDFSKIEAGKFDLVHEPFSLRSTIAAVFEILSLGAAQKNIGLFMNCSPSIPDLIVGDADKLAQILTNLIGNGVKFTKEGSVTLTVRPVHQSGDDRISLHFQVSDTGIGIPADQIDNVFRAFNQIGTTRDSNNRGTGLGLVIAAELVEMMGGKISVDSEPGIGTNFHFNIPFAISHQVPVETLSVAPDSVGKETTSYDQEKALKILLVEDEYINRTLATAVLTKEGWDITTAENGQQALELIADNSFDLVLMDVQMPKMDGFAATKAIRLKERASDIHLPIIAMTAYAIKGDREKCLTAGMDGYIAKPIRPQLLRNEIVEVLTKTAQTQYNIGNLNCPQ